MNTCYVVRSSRPARFFLFGLLDGLQVRLRRPYLREALARFGLERLATAFMNNPGYSSARCVPIGELRGPSHRAYQSRRLLMSVQALIQVDPKPVSYTHLTLPTNREV